MSDYKRWRVTGPDGFNRVVDNSGWDASDPDAFALMVGIEGIGWPTLARQAGYRAEPIEEPKMVTVRAEDVQGAIDMIGAGLLWASHHPTAPYCSTADYDDGSAYGRARKVRARLRAALDGAK